MAPQNGQTCSGCGGRGVLNNGRTIQACPLCGGDGSKPQRVVRVPFWYVFPNAVLTANQAGLVVTQQIDQDTDFEWIWIMASSTGLFSNTPFDSSTGRNLCNNAINGENWAGTAQLPFPLVEPYLLARSTTFKNTLNDRSGAGNTVQIVFAGYKLFPAAAPMQGSPGRIVQQ